MPVTLAATWTLHLTCTAAFSWATSAWSRPRSCSAAAAASASLASSSRPCSCASASLASSSSPCSCACDRPAVEASAWPLTACSCCCSSKACWAAASSCAASCACADASSLASSDSCPCSAASWERTCKRGHGCGKRLRTAAQRGCTMELALYPSALISWKVLCSQDCLTTLPVHPVQACLSSTVHLSCPAPDLPEQPVLL